MGAQEPGPGCWGPICIHIMYPYVSTYIYIYIYLFCFSSVYLGLPQHFQAKGEGVHRDKPTGAPTQKRGNKFSAARDMPSNVRIAPTKEDAPTSKTKDTFGTILEHHGHQSMTQKTMNMGPEGDV